MPTTPRPLLFTILGDVVYAHGGEVSLSSLCKMMAQFGFSEGAVRLAVTRIARQGWLDSRRVGRRSFYSITQSGRRKIKEALKRIYKSRNEPWDHSWRLLTYSIPESRKEARERLRKEAVWLGYGLLANGTWICPYDRSAFIRDLITDLDISEHVRFFTAHFDGPGTDAGIVAACWNIAQVDESYRQFVATYAPQFEQDRRQVEQGADLPPPHCFVQRVNLTNEFRKFIFVDPGLPEELCPPDWVGNTAARLFADYCTLLGHGARHFIGEVMEAQEGSPPYEDPVVRMVESLRNGGWTK